MNEWTWQYPRTILFTKQWVCQPQGCFEYPLEDTWKSFVRLCISVLVLENLCGIPKRIDSGWDRNGWGLLAEKIKRCYLRMTSCHQLHFLPQGSASKTGHYQVIGCICLRTTSHDRVYSHDVSPRSEIPRSGIITPINPKGPCSSFLWLTDIPLLIKHRWRGSCEYIF